MVSSFLMQTPYVLKGTFPITNFPRKPAVTPRLLVFVLVCPGRSGSRTHMEERDQLAAEQPEAKDTWKQNEKIADPRVCYTLYLSVLYCIRNSYTIFINFIRG